MTPSAKTKLTARAAKRLRTVAYHEAGHAVIAHLMGVRFDSIVVDRKPFHDASGILVLGVVNLDADWPDWACVHVDRNRTREYLSRRIQITLAGPLAETLYTRCWQDLPMNEGDDEFMAFEFAELMYTLRKPIGQAGWPDYVGHPGPGPMD